MSKKFTSGTNQRLIDSQVRAIKKADAIDELMGKEPTGKNRNPPNRFKPGEVNNPRGGPKKAEVNMAIKAIVRKQVQDYPLLPLDFFLANLNNPKNSRTFRHDCAKAAAPYVHRKMPIGIDNGSGGPVSFISPEQLALLPSADLLALEAILGRVAMLGQPQTMLMGAAAVQSSEEEDDE